MEIILRQRRFWVAALIIAFVLIMCQVASWCKPSGRMTPRAAATIRAGMTEKEVEQILGGPPGDYRTRTAIYGGLMAIPAGVLENAEQKRTYGRTWTGNEVQVDVLFDQSGRVFSTAINRPAVSQSSLQDWWDALLIRAGLRQPRIWCLN
jgi:hypothetical protein